MPGGIFAVTFGSFRASLAARSAVSFPSMPTWLGIQFMWTLLPLCRMLLATANMLIRMLMLSLGSFLFMACMAPRESVWMTAPCWCCSACSSAFFMASSSVWSVDDPSGSLKWAMVLLVTKAAAAVPLSLFTESSV